jgi:CBS domain-containing protein
MVAEINKLRVKDVMSKDVVAVNPNDTLHEALELIHENRVSALPVINGRDQCVGMLSASDLIELTHDLDDEIQNLGRASAGERPWLVEQLSRALGLEHVSEQMTHDVETIHPEASLPEAAAAMLRNRVHRLPVTNANRRLLGIVSTIDVMRIVANGAAVK